jgi:hypothetical protein
VDTLNRWLDASHAFLSTLAGRTIELLPDLAGAMVLLLLGWAVAGLARALIGRLADALNRFLERFRHARTPGHVTVPGGVVRVAGNVGYWLIIVFFAATAARAAHLEGIAGWLGRILGHVPSIIGAGLIVLAGYVVSTLVRDLVAATMMSAGASHAEAGARFAQGITFLVAIVIAFDQLGIDVTFLVTILSILLGGSLLSLAVAFGLGARELVGNLIGAQDASRHYAPGQSVHIAGVEGEILEFTSTSIVLETHEGRMHVPAKVFHEQASILRVPAG